jgi:DNA (cytosine-5)-methyltransferase 1
VDHKQKLLEIYKSSSSIKNITSILPKYADFIDLIATNSYKQKGVFSVLVTLLVHKILYPAQDIRCHQTQIKGGFSGRTIDTQYITPTLKQLKLPSMAESGWLTRSLEQPYPYTLTYEGKIRDTVIKEAFLNVVDYVQTKKGNSSDVLQLLLHLVTQVALSNKVVINPLTNPEKLTILKVMNALDQHFHFIYHQTGAAKLPVLAFYSLYMLLIKELQRYDGCLLKPLANHTTCDTTSGSSGDIEVFKDGQLYETVEIKQDRIIDSNVVRIAYEKIVKYDPSRYYILSDKGVLPTEKDYIAEYVVDVKEEHGCQIIINGVLPTIKYYLRLITSMEDFVKIYSDLVSVDQEIKLDHKKKWQEIVDTILNV